MRMMSVLALVGILGVAGAAFSEEPSLRFSADEYPQMAHAIDLFEVRFNAEDPAIRRRALTEVTYFRRIPSQEYVRFLRAMMKDADPVVAGNAIKALHALWVPIAPDELPERFSGYVNGQIVTRDDPKRLSQLLGGVHGGGRGVTAGYAAYVAGVLRVQEAAPALVRLAGSAYVFLATTAARALAYLGKTKEAIAAFDAISKEQVRRFEDPPAKPTVPLADVRRPLNEVPDVIFPQPQPYAYYAIYASRGLAQMGGAWRDVAIDRLIRIYACLAVSTEVNHVSHLHQLRMTLHQLTGAYFQTPAAARVWYKNRER